MKYQNCSLDFVTAIPDVIWGSIPITENELRIIKDPLFNRLLEIKQMGCAWVAYPGAVHTRFQHSLGVMHVADQLLGLYKIKNLKGQETYLCEDPVISQNVRQCLRLAGLLHDIGHPPFSHVLEEGLRKNPNVISEKCKESNEFIKAIFSDENYSHEEATKYYLENVINEKITDFLPMNDAKALPLLAIGKSKDYPYNLLNPIINSDLDADKMDYLRRDGYFCGFDPGYKLADFDGVLVAHVIDQANKKYKARFTLNKSAINVINSFLHTRYRLITEYQNNQQARISTQILIDILVNQLVSMKEDIEKQSDLLTRIHLEFRDADIKECFPAASDSLAEFDVIRRGQVSYKEVKLKTFLEDDVLDFSDFSPKQRLFLQILFAYPQSISLFQKLLRQSEKREDLLLDIRTAKPPSFRIPVLIRNSFSASVYYYSEISKGILRDSIKDLKVHFYTKNEKELELTFERFTELLEKTALESMKQQINKDLIPSCVLLLLSIYSVLKHAKVSLGLDNAWLYSQFDIQFVISNICKNLKILSPYHETIENVMDPDCVRDFESLVTFGLIEERTTCVFFPYPAGNKHNQGLKVNRLDYRLTSYGQEFIEEIFVKGHSLEHVATQIQEKISRIQQENSAILSEFYSLENDSYRNPTPSDKDINTSDRRQELRQKIRKAHSSCLIS